MRTSGRAFVVGVVLVVTTVTGSGASPADAGTGTAPESGSSDWRQVSSGDEHTCGIRTSGRLYCWGDDTHGQLGDGGANADQSVPVQVTGGETDWVAVSAGSAHTCARRSTGRIYCWGWDLFGQLGNGPTSIDQATPVQVAGSATNWTALTTGAGHTCARRATGRLYCWGSDGEGELGDGGTSTNRSAPRLVAGGATDWTSVSAGASFTCGRRATGRLYCWGADGSGQLGNGATSGSQQAPTLVSGGATWTSVSTGGSHTCGRRTNRRLYCWGEGAAGQLGNGTTTSVQPVPVPVTGAGWTAVSAGGVHTCGRRATGRLYCWGAQNDGQLGNGMTGGSQLTPVVVGGGATDWTSVDGANAHTCGRIASGRLYCWGLGTSGQLGDRLSVTQSRPSEVFA